ncbi:MAG: hypothetical protein AB1411_00855 [Nitrospirota bacterium]
MTDTGASLSAGRCDACGTDRSPLMKLSLGKDFFGRAYDRLSPSSDVSPKWYCDTCSMHKNLQRDFRDIRTELDKLHAGQASELAKAEQLQRAQLRLREIASILAGLEGRGSAPHLLDPAEVGTLLNRIQAQAGASSVAG